MQKPNTITISKTDKDYPNQLKNLEKPPESIRIKGAPINELLNRSAVAIVGSRKVSGYGRRVTREIAGELAKRDILTISGLALGVDSIAHEEVIASGGKTLAVLPGGIGKIYPKRHAQLAERIVESGGALLSEYENNHSPMKHDFIQRNRIIAGLCDVLLITEAAERSGSLHTARFAMETGKTVSAVPGDIYSPTSTGCNNLIKTGAQPVTGPQDVIECLNFAGRQLSFNDGYYPENEDEKAVMDLLKKGYSQGERLRKLSGLSKERFSMILRGLETKGVVVAGGNDRWRLMSG